MSDAFLFGTPQLLMAKTSISSGGARHTLDFSGVSDDMGVVSVDNDVSSPSWLR